MMPRESGWFHTIQTRAINIFDDDFFWDTKWESIIRFERVAVIIRWEEWYTYTSIFYCFEIRFRRSKIRIIFDRREVGISTKEIIWHQHTFCPAFNRCMISFISVYKLRRMRIRCECYFGLTYWFKMISSYFFSFRFKQIYNVAKLKSSILDISSSCLFRTKVQRSLKYIQCCLHLFSFLNRVEQRFIHTFESQWTVYSMR